MSQRVTQGRSSQGKKGTFRDKLGGDNLAMSHWHFHEGTDAVHNKLVCNRPGAWPGSADKQGVHFCSLHLKIRMKGKVFRWD